MRTKIIIIPLVFLLLTICVSAIKVQEATCYDYGGMELTLKANNEKDSYTKDMALTADDKKIKGSWDSNKLTITAPEYKQATFTGLENQLIEKKTYSIKLAYKEKTVEGFQDAELSFDLECPGLSFTCKRLGIKIEDCLTSKRGIFTSNINIYGLEQSEEKLDPFKVIDYLLEAQILYKDINDYTSKRGSLPKGATITKVGENKYFIEADFGKYTTNHVKSMLVRFNDNLPRSCKPADYPETLLSHKIDCVYKETESDWAAEQKEKEKAKEESLVLGSIPSDIQSTPVAQLKDAVYNEINDLESKKSQIESRLNELYQKREELNSLKEDVKEEPKNTGYSVKDSGEEVSKKKQRLNILLLFLLGVVVVGGSLLAYLYKEGYFY